MAKASFEKHVYGREKKCTLKPLEHFDPRPVDLRGTANERLAELLDKLRDKGLSISLSLDSKSRSRNVEDSQGQVTSEPPKLPSKQELQKE